MAKISDHGILEIINSVKDWPENTVLLIKGKQNSLLNDNIKTITIFYSDTV